MYALVVAGPKAIKRVEVVAELSDERVLVRDGCCTLTTYPRRNLEYEDA